jgi:hypothetical protein
MKPRLITLFIVAVFGCTNEQLQRMVEQPKYLPYGVNDFFEDGRAMRIPEPGTVSRETTPSTPANEGRQPSGAFLQKIPRPITRSLLELGQREFQITCAACHGLLGNGDSVVAEKMSLRAPPSIHDFADRPDGFFYSVISEGYGLMPAYAEYIPAESRWAIVAYLRALQLSQRARLSDAPPEIRAQLLRERR